MNPRALYCCLSCPRRRSVRERSPECGRNRKPYRLFCASLIAAQTRAGVVGMSMWRTPR